VEPWWWSWSTTVAPYAVLLKLLIDKRISGAEFEVVFLPLFKAELGPWPRGVFEVMDTLFGQVDDFRADDELGLDVGDLSEDELRLCAGRAYEQLEKLAVTR
jgi:hypothetical protein